jgi:hypothetical protein
MMAKNPTRPPARQRSRPYRAPKAGPAPLTDSPDIEQKDWYEAEQAASAADDALAQAEGYFQTVAQAAEEAEAAADWALRAAEQAEAAAVWVVADAERLLVAAQARVEAARALARAGRMVAADAQEGEWEAEQADPDVAASLSPTFQAARRAMTAACAPQSRRRDH